MAYLLPRAIIVLAAWGMSCSIIKNISPDASARVYGIAAACWACIGIAYFSYVRLLKREMRAAPRAPRSLPASHSVPVA